MLADEYPRCISRVLLVSQTHRRPHACTERLAVGVLQAQVRHSLLDTFGKVTFWERGGPDQEVAHAQLYGALVVLIGSEWVGRGQVQRIESWAEVQARHPGLGDYVHSAGATGASLVCSTSLCAGGGPPPAAASA
jgi:hypothetical protein